MTGSSTSLDLDFLAIDLRLFPVAHELVLVGIPWIELLNIEILNIRNGVCHAPGYVAVVADYNTGCAGKTGSHDIVIVGNKLALKP